METLPKTISGKILKIFRKKIAFNQDQFAGVLNFSDRGSVLKLERSTKISAELTKKMFQNLIEMGYSEAELLDLIEACEDDLELESSLGDNLPPPQPQMSGDINKNVNALLFGTLNKYIADKSGEGTMYQKEVRSLESKLQDSQNQNMLLIRELDKLSHLSELNELKNEQRFQQFKIEITQQMEKFFDERFDDLQSQLVTQAREIFEEKKGLSGLLQSDNMNNFKGLIDGLGACLPKIADKFLGLNDNVDVGRYPQPHQNEVHDVYEPTEFPENPQNFAGNNTKPTTKYVDGDNFDSNNETGI